MLYAATPPSIARLCSARTPASESTTPSSGRRSNRSPRKRNGAAAAPEGGGAYARPFVAEDGYDALVATVPADGAVPLYSDGDDAAWAHRNVALLFGSEAAGLSDEALSLADVKVTVPQTGMTQSLNVAACAAIRSGRRWCMTGTPFMNSLFDVFGQLVFLGIIGATDVGRCGGVGVIPALHFRLHLDGGGRWQATCNDTADVVTSMLKPLVVRHTKAQMRNGHALLALSPCHFEDLLVEPSTDAALLAAGATKAGPCLLKLETVLLVDSAACLAAAVVSRVQM